MPAKRDQIRAVWGSDARAGCRLTHLPDVIRTPDQVSCLIYGEEEVGGVATETRSAWPI
jgi:hypothetical protein